MGTVKRLALEDVWEIVTEIVKSQKETDRQLNRQSTKLEKSQEEAARQLKEGNLELREAVKKTMRSIDKTNGNFNNK